MIRTRGRCASVTFAALVLLVFAGCGGRSKENRGPGGSGASGGGGGSDVTAAAGDIQRGSCVYNGIRYDSGEQLGQCQECTCTDGGITCDPMACLPAAAGSGGASNSGSAGSSSAASGNAGRGVAGSGSGGAGVAGSSGAGVAGGGNACRLATIGRLCVLGSPTSNGQDLMVGAPLTVSLQPAGCYSSSCTRLVSSSCNYLGGSGKYWISGFICLGSEGDACTDDCGGAPTVSCAPGVTLEAGEYTIGLGGSSESVSFKVPSHVPNDALCVTSSDAQ
ncbi:MAG TPA: hypothetical protein VJV79_39875 [Polyangiaceae bacterium]|nr:hypothetical protein [Polyangiaceae bacterium]